MALANNSREWTDMVLKDEKVVSGESRRSKVSVQTRGDGLGNDLNLSDVKPSSSGER